MEAYSASFWAYFAAYDWALFCWMMGGMLTMPREFPHYCNDLMQEVNRLGFSRINFPANEAHHHALADAKWNRKLHQLLQKAEKNL